MKVVFIIPPDLHYMEPYAHVEVDKSNVVRPMLGLLYVAAELRRSLGLEADFIDCRLDGCDLEDLERVLARETPDVVGFSVLTFNLLNCMEAGRIVRKASPSSVICYGGWHPTLYPEETLALGGMDYIVIGEGEHTFAELASALLKDKNPSEERLAGINGLGYRTESGEFRINPPRDLVRNLDDLPLPAYDLIDQGRYSNLLGSTGQAITIATSRGCPHRCIFCDVRQTPFRHRSPADVVAEIKHWVDRGASEFFIQDDNFTISRRRTLEFCRRLIDSGMKVQYKISSRVDLLSDEVLEQLKKSGCSRIHLGIESGSQEILDYLQKGITVEQVRETFRSAGNYGIDRFAYIMIGAAPERQEHIDQTLRLVKEIKPDHLHCSICTPMPKTFMYRRMMEEGLIEQDYWLDFARRPDPAFQPPPASRLFSKDELRQMQDSIQRRFYFRPRTILREAIKTRSLKQFTTKARLALKMLSSRRPEGQ